MMLAAAMYVLIGVCELGARSPWDVAVIRYQFADRNHMFVSGCRCAMDEAMQVIVNAEHRDDMAHVVRYARGKQTNERCEPVQSGAKR